MGMKKKAHSAEEIIRKLRQAEVSLHEGKSVAETFLIVASSMASHVFGTRLA